MKKILVFFLILAMTASLSNKEYKKKSKGKRRSSSVIELSGENYYPDGIASRKDGTLFVGSMWTGQIDRIPRGSIHPVSFVPPEAEGRTVLGLLVDEDAGRLWAVFWDYRQFMKIPAQLKSFNLRTGKLVEVYEYPEGVIGNDIAMDGEGNIYTTCSFTHRIFRLTAGGNALEIWCDDPVLKAGWKEGFSLNGIEWNGDSSIYVSRTDNNGFYRVSIKNDGSAGVVQQIAVSDTNTNMGYDGIFALDSDTFLLAEYATNRLTMINVTGNRGTKQIVSTGLDFPTNVTVVGDSVWIVESQINHMLGLDKASPQVPFLIKRVLLSSY